MASRLLRRPPPLSTPLWRTPTTPLAVPFTRTHTTATSTGTSVDPTEISHFDGLASTWWDPHGSSRLLHLMNPLRLHFIQTCLLRGPPPPPPTASASARGGLRYLDVGCGGGILAEALARLEGTRGVVGVDASAGVLEVAEAHRRRDPRLVEEGRLRYENCVVEELGGRLRGGEKGGFDVVTMMEVIEHVPHPNAFLYTAMSHVRPGGWLCLSTISRSWISYLTTVFVAEHVLGIVPKGTHDWNKYLNAEELEGFFRAQKGWGGGGGMVTMGCMYLPGLGWKEVKGGEKVGNYFFGVRRDLE
ncbi:S-adenosyl-L-methionine-dependent methyltransferase [Morchella snyderi]|nr:S-adenosyl-L-methionine-dependent methyltransferase [Morchella snyderi]